MATVAAFWHTVEDFAHALGWIGLGILAYVGFVLIFEHFWRLAWERIHASEETDRELLRAHQGSPEFEEALFSRGPLPRPNEREHVS